MQDSFERLKEDLKGDLSAYRGIPFWSWNNQLDESELIKQIEDMHAAGLGGFIMHARTGLKDEYLGEKWFSCIEACLKKARELHMNAWVYDENGWPSGFVGGKLLEKEEYRARFLEYRVLDEFDPMAFCVYVQRENAFERIFVPKKEATKYHTVYLGVSPANTDILNPEVVEEFIRLTHEEYYKRFSESFGRELVGFFTDEPQYYRYATPYTPVAEGIFAQRYGEDIKDSIIHLFVQNERGDAFRAKYYALLNELYTNNYYKKLYDWCEAHGCLLSGHSFEEATVSAQMGGSAGVMPSYANEHVPTIDWLGKYCGNTELSPKQVGSVASQLNKKCVLTETFACSGNDITPKELKSIAEFQYFCGVNLTCHHLFPYSISAQGKHDHPPVFSKHGNWWEEFRVFNEYFARLGYIIANTRENYDVGIIHPLHSVYLDYFYEQDSEKLKGLENDFSELLLWLRKNGIQYQLIDETLLREYGSVEGEELVVGACRYSKIILPNMRSIEANTLNMLQKFRGKLLLWGTPTCVDGISQTVELQSNCTKEDIVVNALTEYDCQDGLSLMTSRTGSAGAFVFIKNYSLFEDSHIKMNGIEGQYVQIDLETLTAKPASSEMTVEKNGSIILLRQNCDLPPVIQTREKDLTADFYVREVGKNTFVSDYAAYSFDGKTYHALQPLPQLFEELLRTEYVGELYIRHTFHLADVMSLTLRMEKGAYQFVRVNGADIALRKSDFDVYFVEGDITPFLHVGKNEVVYKINYHQHNGVHFALFDPMATESVRNCLYYDTHIENVYLLGDFVVDSDMVLSSRKTLPPLTSDLYACGYPFFCGELTIEGVYNYDGRGEREITLWGRFLVASVEVEGRKETIVFGNTRKITHLLKMGKNRVVIKIKSSIRNLFGPHHYKHGDMQSSQSTFIAQNDRACVNPYMFTMRGSWKDGVAQDYTEQYHVLPFGVDKIVMTEYEKEKGETV